MECLRAGLAAIAGDPDLAYPRVLRLTLAMLAVVLVLALVRRWASRDRARARRSWPVRMLSCAWLFVVAMLAATAFVPVVQGQAMRGIAMFLHLAAAGVFMVLLPAVAIQFAATIGRTRGVERCLRFGGIAAGALTAAAMLIAMLPLLSTAQLHEALTLHRYAGLVTVALVILAASVRASDA